MRQPGYESTDIVEMSEEYFALADDTVSAAGDRLILNFARILRQTVPARDFVGRYGGDEFIVLLYDTNQAELKQLLKDLQLAVEQFNQNEEAVRISYAEGWALSTDYVHCNLRMLFDKADKYMYANKQHTKMGRDADEKEN